MKPQPMSDEELSNLVRDAHIKFCLMAGGSFERVFADAIEARVNAQWAAMLGEPVAYIDTASLVALAQMSPRGHMTTNIHRAGFEHSSPLYAIKETP